MPEMRQRAFDSYREIRAENRATVLGMFGVSEVPNDAEPLRCITMKRSNSVRTENKSAPFSSIKQGVMYKCIGLE